jgi:hypothetical protein
MRAVGVHGIAVWLESMPQDPVIDSLWAHPSTTFAGFQVCLVDGDGGIAARLDSAPLGWDGIATRRPTPSGGDPPGCRQGAQHRAEAKPTEPSSRSYGRGRLARRARAEDPAGLPGSAGSLGGVDPFALPIELLAMVPGHHLDDDSVHDGPPSGHAKRGRAGRVVAPPTEWQSHESGVLSTVGGRLSLPHGNASRAGAVPGAARQVERLESGW